MSSLPHFKFNTSTNPLAYVRNTKDINKFIANISSEARKNNVFLQLQELILLELVITFLVRDCNAEDRTLANMIKLLEVARSTGDRKSTTTFEIMLRDSSVEGIYSKYVNYKNSYIQSSICLHNCAIEKLQTFLGTTYEERLLNELINQDVPLQAQLISDDGIKEVWFTETTSSDEIDCEQALNNEIYVVTIPYYLMSEKAKEAFKKYLNIESSQTTYKDFLNNNCQTILDLLKKHKDTEHQEMNFIPLYDDSCFETGSGILGFVDDVNTKLLS